MMPFNGGRIVSAKDALHDKLRDSQLYRLIRTYGAGLNRREIETFLRRDTLNALSYYRGNTETQEAVQTQRDELERIIATARNVFLSFLLKLTPARRLFYAIALILFVWGLFVPDKLALIAGAFAILNVLLALELADKLLTKDELVIARAIQFSLQPEVRPQVKNLTLACHYQPARDVGGDYYDFSPENSERLTVIMGDVSGKGIAAALYAMKLQALFEMLGKEAMSPKQMLIEMNGVISERIKKNYFITAVVGELDFQSNELRLARAGHNWPMHFDARSGRIEWLKPRGLGIGMKKNPDFGVLMEETRVTLGAGDVLVFYTDGISEAMDRTRQPFGYDRMEDVLNKSAHLDAENIKGKLLSEVETFTRGAPLEDDATIVIAKING